MVGEYGGRGDEIDEVDDLVDYRESSGEDVEATLDVANVVPAAVVSSVLIRASPLALAPAVGVDVPTTESGRVVARRLELSVRLGPLSSFVARRGLSVERGV